MHAPAATAALALALGACISSDSVVCADGRVCAAGSVCHRVEVAPAETVCVTPEELAACGGRADFSHCGEGGRCYTGACLPGGCGNRRVDLADPQVAGDPAEACDDGNTSPGDGCSADCSSDETCRNGTLDFVGGESCDDRNALGHDGCSSTCEAEPVGWTLDEAPVVNLESYAMAYDARRERVVVFGGEIPGLLIPIVQDRTLEWDGRWRLLLTPIAPSARTQAAMAYDAARDRVVLFGGSAGGLLGDTWEWDGAAWIPRTPAHAPSRRAGHAMAYDPIRQRVVLFGGLADTTPFGDTWEWDGTDWARDERPGPPARLSSGLAFDARRGAIVLFAGDTYQQGLLGDTWVRDANGWHEVAVAPALPPRARHAMATDPTTGAAVVIGGGDESATPEPALALRFTGTGWEPLPGVAPAIERHAVAPMPRQGALVMIGGGLVHTWRAGAWTARAEAQTDLPRLRERHAAATDPLGRRAMVFGGTDAAGTSDETWLWDGAWRPIEQPAPLARPAARVDHGLAFDARARRFVLFGGQGTGPAIELLGDTWTSDGAVWVRHLVPGPPARAGVRLAYDAARERTVLFGGAAGGVQLDDTWTWDGAAWSLRTVAARPPARARAAIAYDAIRREVVMFGGAAVGGALADTWIWNGTAWREVTPIPSPSARSSAALAFEPARGRLVLYGGYTGTSGLSDAWEWDGARWSPIGIALPVRARHEHVMIPSPLGDGLIVHGGVQLVGEARNLLDERLQLRRGVAPTEDRCVRRDTDDDDLAGCADPDCWVRCTPGCPPGLDPAAPECASAARCGDGTCNRDEDCALCAADCGPCPASCGDHRCDPPEDPASCPGDCTPVGP